MVNRALPIGANAQLICLDSRKDYLGRLQVRWLLDLLMSNVSWSVVVSGSPLGYEKAGTSGDGSPNPMGTAGGALPPSVKDAIMGGSSNTVGQGSGSSVGFLGVATEGIDKSGEVPLMREGSTVSRVAGGGGGPNPGLSVSIAAPVDGTGTAGNVTETNLGQSENNPGTNAGGTSGVPSVTGDEDEEEAGQGTGEEAVTEGAGAALQDKGKIQYAFKTLQESYLNPYRSMENGGSGPDLQPSEDGVEDRVTGGPSMGGAAAAAIASVGLLRRRSSIQNRTVGTPSKKDSTVGSSVAGANEPIGMSGGGNSESSTSLQGRDASEEVLVESGVIVLTAGVRYPYVVAYDLDGWGAGVKFVVEVGVGTLSLDDIRHPPQSRGVEDYVSVPNLGRTVLYDGSGATAGISSISSSRNLSESNSAHGGGGTAVTPTSAAVHLSGDGKLTVRIFEVGEEGKLLYEGRFKTRREPLVMRPRPVSPATLQKGGR